MTGKQKVIMILGVQRSGTTALFETLSTASDLTCWHEAENSPIYLDWYLRPEPEIREHLVNSKYPVLLKPVRESELRSPLDILSEYHQYNLHMLWLYRDPVNVIYSYHQIGWIDGSEQAIRTMAEQWRDRNEHVIKETEVCGNHLTVLGYEELISSPTLVHTLSRELGISVISELRPDSMAGRLHMPPEHQRVVDEICKETRAKLNNIRMASSDALTVLDSAPASTGCNLVSQWPKIRSRLKSPDSIPDNFYINANPEIVTERDNVPYRYDPVLHALRVSDYNIAFSLIQQRVLLSPVEYIWTIAPVASSSALHLAIGTLLSTDAGHAWLHLLLEDIERCFAESAYRVINWKEALSYLVHSYLSMLPRLIIEAAQADPTYDHKDEQAAYLTTVSTGYSDYLEAFLTTVMLHCLTEPEFASCASQSNQLMDLAIRELLRFYPPVVNVTRRLNRDVDLPEIALTEGTTICLGIAAANRDPQVFPDPNIFLLAREGAESLTLMTGAPVHRGLTGQILYIVAEKVIRLAACCTLSTPDTKVPQIHYEPLSPCAPRYLNLLLTPRE